MTKRERSDSICDTVVLPAQCTPIKPLDSYERWQIFTRRSPTMKTALKNTSSVLYKETYRESFRDMFVIDLLNMVLLNMMEGSSFWYYFFLHMYNRVCNGKVTENESIPIFIFAVDRELEEGNTDLQYTILASLFFNEEFICLQDGENIESFSNSQFHCINNSLNGEIETNELLHNIIDNEISLRKFICIIDYKDRIKVDVNELSSKRQVIILREAYALHPSFQRIYGDDYLKYLISISFDPIVRNTIYRQQPVRCNFQKEEPPTNNDGVQSMKFHEACKCITAGAIYASLCKKSIQNDGDSLIREVFKAFQHKLQSLRSSGKRWEPNLLNEPLPTEMFHLVADQRNLSYTMNIARPANDDAKSECDIHPAFIVTLASSQKIYNKLKGATEFFYGLNEYWDQMFDSIKPLD